MQTLKKVHMKVPTANTAIKMNVYKVNIASYRSILYTRVEYHVSDK